MNLKHNSGIIHNTQTPTSNLRTAQFGSFSPVWKKQSVWVGMGKFVAFVADRNQNDCGRVETFELTGRNRDRLNIVSSIECVAEEHHF